MTTFGNAGWDWPRRKPKTFPNAQAKGWETRRRRMALDFNDNVDPPDGRLSPERLNEIRELSRCEEFVDEKSALLHMRVAVLDLLCALDGMVDDPELEAE